MLIAAHGRGAEVLERSVLEVGPDWAAARAAAAAAAGGPVGRLSVPDADDVRTLPHFRR